MKNIILCIGFGMLILTAGLTSAAIDEKVSPLLAALSGLETIYLLTIGRKMQLELIDARISAVVIFLAGEFLIWQNWFKNTEMMELGFAIGIIFLFAGVFWGSSQYYYDKEEPGYYKTVLDNR